MNSIHSLYITVICLLWLTSACSYGQQVNERSGELLAQIAPGFVTSTPVPHPMPTRYGGSPTPTADTARVTIEFVIEEIPATPQPAPQLTPVLKVNDNQFVYLYKEASTAEPLFILQAGQELFINGFMNTPKWYLVCCSQSPNGNLGPMWIDGQDGNRAKFTIQNENQLQLSYLPITPTPTANIDSKPRAEVKDSATVYLYANPGGNAATTIAWNAKIPLDITGITIDNQWYRVCCIDLNSTTKEMWFSAADKDKIDITNEENIRSKATPVAPPTPTAIPIPFSRARGPEYWQSGNTFLTILIKIYAGQSPNEEPQPGYLIAAEFRAVDQTMIQKRLNQTTEKVSVPQFSRTVGDNLFNYKYEYHDDLGSGKWKIWLTNAEGHLLWLQDDPLYKDFRLSEEITFDLDPGNPNKEIYIAWIRVN